jgi:hypothetical protein
MAVRGLRRWQIDGRSLALLGSVAAILLLILSSSGVAPSRSTPPLRPLTADNQPLNVSAPNWTEVQSASSPAGRSQPSMAYDPVDGYVLLFGGFKKHTNYGDTWTYTGGVWKKLNGKGSPPPARHGAMMVWDAADQYILLFGGSNWTQYMNDTWKFQNGHWTQLFPVVSPPARRVAGVAYDSTDGYVVMFSGHSGTNVEPNRSKGYTGYDDTWTFRGGNWTEVTPAVSPAVRADSQMADDPALGGAILFGGYGPADTISFSDTWLFTAGTWINLTGSLSTYPPARNAVGLALDPVTGADVLFGGLQFSHGRGVPTKLFNDTWVWANSTWTEVFPAVSPPARAGEGMAWDGVDGYFVIFGGLAGAAYESDTWTYP